MRFTISANQLGGASMLALSLALSPSVLAEPVLGKDPLPEVIAAMTLEEKIKLVHGTGMSISGANEEETDPAVGETDTGRVEGAAGNTYAIPRLGIPSIVLADGPAGLRIQPIRENDPDNTYYCTAFPIATLLASSWDTELIENVGTAMGEEVKEYGVDILLAPGMNLQRYPLGGRNFEYYSEDPLLTGKMAAAMVRGVQSNGVGTSIKHYVANNHEWNRNKIDVQVDEKTLRELYLKGFEIAVKESDPWTVMSSYNKVNGTYTSESYELLTETLRHQWGFDGFVMTDWFGGADAVAQIEAGNDLLMPGTKDQAKQLLEGSKSGELDTQALDRSVEDILRVVMRTPTFKGYKYSNKPNLKANADVSRRAATEGMVLLKNKRSVLPLVENAKLALFGNTSYAMITGGTGSGDVNEAYSVSLLDGLENQGFVVDAGLGQQYTTYIAAEEAKRPKLTGIEAFLSHPPIDEYMISDAAIADAAKNNDIGLITIGRNSGEFADREPAHFELNEFEQGLIARVSVAFKKAKKPVVVVLNIGGPVEMVSWRDKVDAILLAWQPGQEAGNAIADILDGAVTPSGKLAATFPLSLSDAPASEGFPGKVDDVNYKPEGLFRSQPASVVYTDKGEVGYRHYNAEKDKVAYPFGYGLSYTAFTFSNVKVSNPDDSGNVAVTLTVKNTGNYAGKEVVQVYAGKKMGKYATALKGFKKTSLLKPGASENLKLVIDTHNLAEYAPTLAAWYAKAGKYEFAIGSSSRDIKARKTIKLPLTMAK